MNKKKAIETIKGLKGEYEIELKLQPCCCKMHMEKVFDTFNNSWFYLCRKCGKIREDVK